MVESDYIEKAMIAIAHSPFRVSILPDAYMAKLRIRLFLLQFPLLEEMMETIPKIILHSRDIRILSKTREACHALLFFSFI
jgi:hypothetical protein